MDDDFSGLFWPQYTQADPGFFARLGRRTHWAVAAGAAFFSLTGVWSWAHGGQFDWQSVCVWGVAYMVARGFRYLMAGE